MKHQSLIALLSLMSCLALVAESDGCKYTVRDVAFVNLSEAPYRLLIVTEDRKSAALGNVLKIAANSALADANVMAEWIDVGSAEDPPAAELATRAGASTYPCALLVSPDGRALNLDWKLSAATTAEQLSPLLSNLVTSPRRTEIFGKVLDVHSVILVVDGPDEKANREITAVAQDAIVQVEQALQFLPKPIKHPPHIIHFAQQEAQRESVLLWSLGVDLSDSAPPQIALVFGRGRQLGPVLRFPPDDPRQLTRHLAFVGLDCECGLDSRWMQGQMIPHLWSNQDESLAVQKLDFDPGNPLVKAEMDRILARGRASRRGQRRDVAQPEVMFPALGYQEIVITDEPPEDHNAESPVANGHPQPEPIVSAEQTPTATEVAGVTEQTVTENDMKENAGTETDVSQDDALTAATTPVNYTFVGLIVLAGLIVAMGCLIMLRGRRA